MTTTTPVRVAFQTIGTLHPGAHDLIRDGLYCDLGGKLRNPHHDPAMRYLTGLDDTVREHVLRTPGAMELTLLIAESAKDLAHSYSHRDGRTVHVTVACRGGRHRSVAIAEQAADYLRCDEIPVSITHRHIHLPVVERQ